MEISISNTFYIITIIHDSGVKTLSNYYVKRVESNYNIKYELQLMTNSIAIDQILATAAKFASRAEAEAVRNDIIAKLSPAEIRLLDIEVQEITVKEDTEIRAVERTIKNEK